ncbi:tubulin binding cofactor C-domain-containing protein [Lineolata rhizophorae]|uniref:Tubulin binding cofactor C-domain-containing protein n=1 Tax=Lineolata rhizophorae TaxID=578093 RepID=A0A6A6P764_9PEZI|nr:tubulin binding cofactor C-domain-containing protein [Lineolata rhizophorae]
MGDSTPPEQKQEHTLQERFFHYFQHEVTALQEEMERVGDTALAGGERNDAIDHCLAGIARLSHEVKDASSYIPAYDQRTYSEAIKALNEKLQRTRTAHAPRPKFAFKTTRKNPSAISLRDAAEMASQTSRAGGRSRLTPGQPNKLSVAGAGKTAEEEPGGQGAGGSVDASGLRRSVVDLAPRPLATLTLRDVREGLVMRGAVAGAVHATGVEASVLLVRCRQLRLHACRGLDVYLHCASRPIVEDCEGVRFAPLPGAWDGDGVEGPNQWDQVDDFKWLKAEPSPHWSILPPEERIKDAVWEDVFSTVSASDYIAEDVLKAVSILKS